MIISLLTGFEARFNELINSLPPFRVPTITEGDVGLVLFSSGVLFGLLHIHKQWPKWEQKWDARRFAKAEALRKKKRTKEAMDNREVQLRMLLSDIITDGLLTAGANQKISLQEEKRLLKELSMKLNLPDLIPTKTRSEIVKQEIKARRAKGFYKQKAKLPGHDAIPDDRGVVIKAAKYWRKKVA